MSLFQSPMNLTLPTDFPHEPPKGYAYKVKSFRRNVVAIWLQHPDRYNFSSDRVSTIWGFYNTKSGTYSAPINATKCGDTVNISDTRPFTAMQLNLNPLEAAFL